MGLVICTHPAGIGWTVLYTFEKSVLSVFMKLAHGANEAPLELDELADTPPGMPSCESVGP